MLVASLVTSSAAILISFIGFSEVLALLPIINLDYPETLNMFFRGIAGLNFQMYDMGSYMEKLPFTQSSDDTPERYKNAGLEV